MSAAEVVHPDKKKSSFRMINAQRSGPSPALVFVSYVVLCDCSAFQSQVSKERWVQKCKLHGKCRGRKTARGPIGNMFYLPKGPNSGQMFPAETLLQRSLSHLSTPQDGRLTHTAFGDGLLVTGPVQVWAARGKSPCSLLAAYAKSARGRTHHFQGGRTHHFQEGRQNKGDVDLSGNAVVDDWTEVLLVKYCLEGSRVHPMLVKA